MRAPFLLLLLTVAVICSAHESPRRGSVHQHSVATGQLALEAGRIDLLLQIPGANLVGFEHPPRDAAQAEQLAAARQRLLAGDWLQLPARAECRPQIELSTPGFAAAQPAAGADPDHDQDHEHDHAEFLLTATAECARPAALEWIEIRLFDGWPDNRSLRIDALTDRGQARFELDPAKTRIPLQ